MPDFRHPQYYRLFINFSRDAPMGGRCSYPLDVGVEAEALGEDCAGRRWCSYSGPDVLCWRTAHENEKLRLMLQQTSAQLQAAESELKAAHTAADITAQEVMALRSQLQQELQRHQISASEESLALEAHEEQASEAYAELAKLRTEVSEQAETGTFLRMSLKHYGA